MMTRMNTNTKLGAITALGALVGLGAACSAQEDNRDKLISEAAQAQNDWADQAQGDWDDVCQEADPSNYCNKDITSCHEHYFDVCEGGTNGGNPDLDICMEDCGRGVCQRRSGLLAQYPGAEDEEVCEYTCQRSSDPEQCFNACMECTGAAQGTLAAEVLEPYMLFAHGFDFDGTDSVPPTGSSFEGIVPLAELRGDITVLVGFNPSSIGSDDPDWCRNEWQNAIAAGAAIEQGPGALAGDDATIFECVAGVVSNGGQFAATSYNHLAEVVYDYGVAVTDSAIAGTNGCENSPGFPWGHYYESNNCEYYGVWTDLQLGGGYALDYYVAAGGVVTERITTAYAVPGYPVRSYPGMTLNPAGASGIDYGANILSPTFAADAVHDPAGPAGVTMTSAP
ncbi:MAG: hypothetical protein AAGA56_14110 [Myxococcota bacterium]